MGIGYTALYQVTQIYFPDHYLNSPEFSVSEFSLLLSICYSSPLFAIFHLIYMIYRYASLLHMCV